VATPSRTLHSPHGLPWLDGSILTALGAVCALLLAGVVMAVIATRTTEPRYPAGSPPHAVTTYLRLLQEGKVDAAYTMTAFADDGKQLMRIRCAMGCGMVAPSWSRS
jgi:hypothetical protein